MPKTLSALLVTCLLAFPLTPVLQAAEPAKQPAGGGDAKAPQTRELIQVSAKDGLTVLLDVNDVPEAKEWALKAADYAIKWYPELSKRLASEGYEPPKEVTLEFKHMRGVAHTRDRTITIAAKWIKDNPEDIGMVAHELVHVVQRYHRGGPGWLTEGIADYLRYYVVEPGVDRARFDPDRSSYKSGYQPAAGLLNYIETQKPGAVAKMNDLLRAGQWTDDSFKEIAGGTPDELWEQFKASQAKDKKAAAAK